MKKHLIAAAVAAAVAAPAMAQNVSLSGFIDMGVSSFDAQTPGGVNDKQFTGFANNTGTSTLAVNVSEDLGGGMSVAFKLGNDLAVAGVGGIGGANNTGATLGLGESFLALTQKGIGTVRLGNVNTQITAASGIAQPFGTGMGSAYSGNFSRFTRYGLNGTQNAAVTADGHNNIAANGTLGSGTRPVRTNNTLVLESDVFNGFSALYSMVSRNADPNENAPNNGTEEIALKYSGMGLNVIAAQYKYTAGATAVALNANEEVKHTLVGANYALSSNLTLMGGWGSTKSSRVAVADTSSRNIALRYAMTPAVSVLANYVRVDDQLAANQDRALTGLGLNYALSKRTNAYVRYETGDHNKSTDAAGKFTNYGAGLAHTF